MNVMKKISVEKITINFSAGKDQNRLDKGITLIKMITGIDPVKTITQERIPGWGLRPGLPIGAKLTLRGQPALDVLKRFLEARDNKLPTSCVDDFGNISFGIAEYIDIPGVKYDPKIPVMGIQISVTLKRPGFRVLRRKLQKTSPGKNHQIRKNESMAFLTEHFGTEFEK